MTDCNKLNRCISEGSYDQFGPDSSNSLLHLTGKNAVSNQNPVNEILSLLLSSSPYSSFADSSTSTPAADFLLLYKPSAHMSDEYSASASTQHAKPFDTPSHSTSTSVASQEDLVGSPLRMRQHTQIDHVHTDQIAARFGLNEQLSLAKAPDSTLLGRLLYEQVLTDLERNQWLTFYRKLLLRFPFAFNIL